MGLRLIETASALPENRVSNKELESFLDTSDQWIKRRTGISSRFISKGEDTSDLVIRAVRKLRLDRALKDRIGLILVASTTPDSLLPNIASKVHLELGLGEKCFSLDINMACSGYVAALNLADKFLEEGSLGLIIGAEVLSKIVDFKDRSTAILFGDGVGLGIFEKTSSPSYYDYGTIGDKKSLSCLSTNLKNRPIRLEMDGKEVYKFAVDVVPASIKRLLTRAKLEAEDLDYFICHQANKRILSHIAKDLAIGLDKLPMNIDRLGNTSSASIPLLLDELRKQNKLNGSKRILLTGFGAGLTWSTALLEW